MTSASHQQEIRELLCQRCDEDYPVWFAPNDLWNRVIRDHGGDVNGHDHFLCPRCFTMLAEERGVTPTAWVVSAALPNASRVS